MALMAAQPRSATPPVCEASAPLLPVYVPERSASERRTAALVFLFSVAYLLIFRRYTPIEPDEGIILQGAQRVLRGEVPYRDFFTFLTPGSFYLHALLFKIAGNSFLVARTALAAFGGVFSVIGYLLARRVCSRGIALLAITLATATTLPYRFLVLHNWDSTLFACVTVYCAIRLIEKKDWKWAFWLGSFAALTILFEQSKGAGLCLGLLIGFSAVSFVKPPHVLRAIHILAIGIGVVWPAMVTLVYFAWQHALQPMFTDLIWPFLHYSNANRVPYGYQNWSDAERHLLFGTGSVGFRALKGVIISPCFIVPLLPLVAVGMFIYWMVQARKHGSSARGAYYLIITGTISGLLLSVVMVRADIIHFMYLLPLFSLPLAWILEGRDICGRSSKITHNLIFAYLVVAFGAFAFPLLSRAATAPGRIETRRGVINTAAEDTVLPYVEAHVSPDETMLVYPYLPIYYYLTGAINPTRYDFFQPGMNTSGQSAEILSEMSSGHVRVVLFESSFAEKIPNAWPHTPLSAIAQDPVADYIAKNYRTCKLLHSPQQWRFLFMVRKETACPS
jgi:4-amino-4-deoxy-L-arabinose transferase-like glycosyltransferase